MNDQPLTDGQTLKRSEGMYNIIPRHFLWRGIKYDDSSIVLDSCL